MEVNSKTILVGPAASGKDYAKSILKKAGFKAEVSYTSRPMRKGEIDGETYNFVSDGEFDYMIANGEFLQYQEFNGWKYGTTTKQFEESNLFIMNVEGLSKIDTSNARVIYFNPPLVKRHLRLIARGGADNVARRLVADGHQFRDFENYDVMITNPLFTEDDLLSLV